MSAIVRAVPAGCSTPLEMSDLLRRVQELVLAGEVEISEHGHEEWKVRPRIFAPRGRYLAAGEVGIVEEDERTP